MTSKTIEQKYLSMSQEQHILMRPDTYIGDTQLLSNLMYVYDDDSNKIVKKQISYVPGLYKIFDEILVNARDQTEIDATCNIIKININIETNQISVYNNGIGIDIEIHNEHNCYVPELIFGKLLTSTNYDDTEARTTGGRNGYGAKLANIFSKEFIVEIVDINRNKKYSQTFTNNMTQKTEPKITTLKKCKTGYTKITFIPDFEKFNLTGLTSEIIALFKKRSYDLAGVTTKCKIYYNDIKIECNNFENYIKLYSFNEEEEYKLYYEKINESWELCLIYAPNLGTIEQISFINGICTCNGGTHINHIIDSIYTIIKTLLQKKHKDITLKPHQVKENIIVFVKGIVINPSFTSQTKETLKTKYNEFGSTCDITLKNINKFIKSGILDQIINVVKIKEQTILKKTDGKKSIMLKGIPKLEDANKAGSKDSHTCKLILTEGDSAKALAMSGRSIVGSDYYGIFPLKGKLLNVREATPKQLLENEEINNIKKIMGFQHNKEYNDVSNLRYGGIILMTDQDSVTGDTPLTIKINNKISIISIERLYNMKDLKEVLIWSDRGWTNVNKIMRHYVTKQINRVITNLGAVDVTVDHSLLTQDGIKISPKDLELHSKLLHKSYKSIYIHNKGVSTTKAYSLGKRCAFSLIKQKKALIPSNILNGTRIIREHFVKGLLYITNIISSNNKLTIHKLYFVLSSLNYNVYISYTNNDIYKLHLSKFIIANDNEVKAVINLKCKSQYVYDIETNNHHFQAGVGCMIVHNTDGYHIKGLLLNFIHYFWPSLLKIDNFITSLTTPIVKAVKGQNVLTFYNIPDYQHWKNENDIKGFNIKYYKGLGTSNAKEAKEYFTNIDEKLINYIDNSSNEEANINTNAILLAFEKKHADDRKSWLQLYDKEIVLHNNQKQVSITDFINKELIHFSNEDISRSIPSLCDGLKPSQRKILYGSILKKINNKNHEIKVAQLAGFIAEKTCYHHGEASLTGTIINMAQNYVGSNNINLLSPSGQFGTRISGKDAASPRYIYTYIEELTRFIFRPEDDDILHYLDDDGVSIEPEFFIPIIPMILINGTEGIGTGFSTKILCFNPIDIINNLVFLIKNEEDKIIPLHIWYKNFIGKIEHIDGTYYIYGCYTIVNDTHLKITELPIGVWIVDYKITLNILETKGIIKKYISNCTEEIIDILVEIDETNLSNWIETNIVYTRLNLVVKKTMTNMHLYNAENKIKKYDSAMLIIKEFYNIRLDYYKIRKKHLINKLTDEYNLLKARMQFINDILDKRIVIERKSKQDIIKSLEELNYTHHLESYDYLINMPIYSLSLEKLEDLEHKCKTKENEIVIIKNTSEEDTWINELNELLQHYKIWLEHTKINYSNNTTTASAKKKIRKTSVQ